MTKRRWLLLCAMAGLLASTLSALWIRDPGLARIRHWKKISDGNRLVSAIEAFKTRNNRLPASLSELGIHETEEGPLYYRRVGDDLYVIWFGIDVGESLQYNSQTRRWE